MMRDALILRKSVYEKGFRCNICETVLADADGQPDGRTLYNGEILQCPRCFNVVAVKKQVDLPDWAHGCMGSYSEYERRQNNGRT
jgi:phage FluMu protein Com